jgi:6-phosphofructokinase
VVEAHNFSPLSLLKKHNVDVYCLSREWIDTKEKEIKYMKSKGGSVFLTHDYKVVRTRNIKKSLLEEAKAGV